MITRCDNAEIISEIFLSGFPYLTIDMSEKRILHIRPVKPSKNKSINAISISLVFSAYLFGNAGMMWYKH